MRLKLIREKMAMLIEESFPLLANVTIEVIREDGEDYFMLVKRKPLSKKFTLAVDKSVFDMPTPALYGCLARELCSIEYELKVTFWERLLQKKRIHEKIIDCIVIEKDLGVFLMAFQKYQYQINNVEIQNEDILKEQSSL